MRLEEIQKILSRTDISMEQVTQALVGFLQLKETGTHFRNILDYRLSFPEIDTLHSGNSRSTSET